MRQRRSEGMKLIRKDVRGSALLTVIVFVAFITILATILLYITGVNHQIKQNDYRNKKNFYSAETALEEIKAELMVLSSEAAVTAYNRTMKDFVQLGLGTSGGAGSCKSVFNQYYAQELQKILEDRKGSGSWADLLTSYRTNGTLEVTNEGTCLNTTKIMEGSLRLQGIKLTYVNDDGYATVITTDFKLEAPDMGWEDTASEIQPYALKDRNVELNNANGMLFVQNATEVVDVSKCIEYINWVKR